MVTIEWNDKPILRCQNRVIVRFYAEVEKIIEKNKINLIFHLDELMWHLDLCGNGIWFDIYKYIYSKEDLRQFIEVLKEALDQLHNYDAKILLDNFYDELVKAYESFVPDPVLLKSVEEFDFYLENPEMFSAALKYNRKYLLVCPAETFCLLFGDILSNILQKNNVILSRNVAELINDLQGKKTGSIDISTYTNCKDEIAFFADLMREAIDTIYKRYPEDISCHEIFYELFYKILLETIQDFTYFTK